MSDLNHANVPTGISKLACAAVSKHTGINFLAEEQKVLLQGPRRSQRNSELTIDMKNKRKMEIIRVF